MLGSIIMSVYQKRGMNMAFKRRLVVHILATIAFIALFLLPVIGFFAAETNASSTAESASVSSGDYIFFIVENNDVPLAAAPAPKADISSYILWIGLLSFGVIIAFVYCAWYVTTRNNIRELTYKMTPFERNAFNIASGFLHPIKYSQLAREAEDTVASMYLDRF